MHARMAFGNLILTGNLGHELAYRIIAPPSLDVKKPNKPQPNEFEQVKPNWIIGIRDKD